MNLFIKVIKIITVHYSMRHLRVHLFMILHTPHGSHHYDAENNFSTCS